MVLSAKKTPTVKRIRKIYLEKLSTDFVTFLLFLTKVQKKKKNYLTLIFLCFYVACLAQIIISASLNLTKLTPIISEEIMGKLCFLAKYFRNKCDVKTKLQEII